MKFVKSDKKELGVHCKRVVFCFPLFLLSAGSAFSSPFCFIFLILSICAKLWQVEHKW